MNKMQRRSQLKELLRNKEIAKFYDEMQISLREGHIIGGVLNIPEIVRDRIKDLMAMYSGLYDEVQVVPVGVDGRIFVSVGEAVAKWNNATASEEELESSIDLLEVEDIKVSGYITVSNAALKDSEIETAMYIEELLAKAMGYAIDNGILNGAGNYEETVVYEPIGILKNLPESNIVTTEFTVPKILSSIGLIDKGKKEDIGEVVAVMKRQTYYGDILPITTNVLPYPNINGIRVKYSAAVGDNEIILGDLKEYILAERSGIKIIQSEHQKFIQDQTVFKTIGRYDGKPHNDKAFVKLIKQV
ncbi:phage major capsid protein [Clostridium beijerinckii]|uniref:HK97 family phage major capsid protein n=1 Tax=Clostridium beijerinckii TaxID=1520 RepID=A0AAX0B092_CLOBE|nr:phage major capsid protein [Clostridium beijerinckii]NRT88725.1 HK97 family phage major capsid protein [Clostridium beijerinckii]NYC74180.1 HK97 family phage major capsid protein [Clostridium beijerinckii]